MTLPVLQPVLQEESQVGAVLDAAVDYGSEGAAGAARAPGAAAAPPGPRTPRASPLRRGPPPGGGRVVVGPPLPLPAPTVPVAAAGALAALDHRFRLGLFLAALVGGLLLHIGTNVINEIYDVRRGIDTITSPRASHALLKGRLSEREAFGLAFTSFALGVGMGVWLVVDRGWPVVGLGLAGLLGGLGYTAPPLQYKYRALGLPLVFLLMGPVMVVGSYFVITGTFDGAALVLSIPVGLLVAA